jgi:pullulanase-type alpha-1,6-glucosidase
MRSLLALFAISTFALVACKTTTPSEPEPREARPAVQLTIENAAAHWVSADVLLWNAPEGTERVELKYTLEAGISITDTLRGETARVRTITPVAGGNAIETSAGGQLNPEIANKLRHIADWPAFEVHASREVIAEALKDQVLAVAFDADDMPITATQVQVSGVIDDLFAYDGKLGPIYTANGISLKVWAPTAKKLSLKIYNADKSLAETQTTTPKNGVWQFEGPSSWDRKFYRFDVEAYHPVNQQINRYEVTDPYSVSLSANSEYSQFVDLANDATLKPQNWDAIKKTQPRPVDITLYEAHMRDFSAFDETVAPEHRGTYLAFTYNGKNNRALSTGMKHLKALAGAGLTHIHLLPVNDITTVRENRKDRVDLDDPYSRICDFIDSDVLAEDCARYGDTPIREVFERLANRDPITDQIQRPYARAGRYSTLAVLDGFNWGYDPFHFNAPEGSYSTDADGPARILELREMVKALDEIGLKVVVDVVYNHTSSAGLGNRSVLDRIVPGYYQRLDATTGAVETSTCCPNTASEFIMMEKLMIDSIVLWAKMYKIDSFRFDLMGHHPLYVMENIQKALAKLTLEEHGVDGANIYIYGEGWNFGEVADNRIFDQATQFMTGGTGIGNFNDRLRDGIRGRNFTDVGRMQGFTSGQYLFPNEDASPNASENLARLLYQADQIRVGLAGNLSTYRYINRDSEVVAGGKDGIGYTRLPQENVNYIDKHDNETLFDNTQTKLPMDFSTDDRVRVHVLSNAFINFGQGVPFFHMGTDILRSKSLDRNSYDSGDWYNMVDFTMQTHNWGRGLPPGWDNRDRWSAMRPLLTNPNIDIKTEHMMLSNALFREQLQIRYSSPLFRLETAEEVHKRVQFHNTGTDQIPGVIVMSLSDGACAGENLDAQYEAIIVVFNASLETKNIDLGLSGFELHPIQATGTDPVVKSARNSDGVFTVPRLTAAVFVKKEGQRQGTFSCNAK